MNKKVKLQIKHVTTKQCICTKHIYLLTNYKVNSNKYWDFVTIKQKTKIFSGARDPKATETGQG